MTLFRVLLDVLLLELLGVLIRLPLAGPRVGVVRAPWSGSLLLAVANLLNLLLVARLLLGQVLILGNVPGHGVLEMPVHARLLAFTSFLA